jgi:hypothetical protein
MLTLRQIINAIDAGGCVFLVTADGPNILRRIPVSTKAFRLMLSQDPGEEDVCLDGKLDCNGDVLLSAVACS